MDQALKARLIGAAVLVALAVVLIPELLSGRRTAGSEAGPPAAARGTRTFTIELGGGAPASATSATPAHVPAIAPPPVPAQMAHAAGPATPPAASAPGSNAVAGPAGSTAGPDVARPAAGPPSANPAHAPAASAAQPAPSTAQAAPARPASPPSPSPSLSPGSSQPRGGWAVQVGAFGSATAAQKMVDDLKSAGYRAYLSPVTRSGKTLNRVRVGPETERARADGLAASLKSRGLPATVVGND